jgi:predicted transposase YdaD
LVSTGGGKFIKVYSIIYLDELNNRNTIERDLKTSQILSSAEEIRKPETAMQTLESRHKLVDDDDEFDHSPSNQVGIRVNMA